MHSSATMRAERADGMSRNWTFCTWSTRHPRNDSWEYSWRSAPGRLWQTLTSYLSSQNAQFPCRLAERRHGSQSLPSMRRGVYAAAAGSTGTGVGVVALNRTNPTSGGAKEESHVSLKITFSWVTAPLALVAIW